jgi:hypothetical protein
MLATKPVAPTRVAHIELEVGATLILHTENGTPVTVTVGEKSGRRVRLRVCAPDSVSISAPRGHVSSKVG